MSIATPAPPEVLVARKIPWRKRLWVRVLLLLALTGGITVAIWWWPRRTMVAMWRVNGQATCTADRENLRAIVQRWDPSGTGWLSRNWERIGQYHLLARTDAEINGVNLIAAPVGDEWLVRLRRMPRLEWLMMDDRQVGPGLIHLQDHTQLKLCCVVAASGEHLRELRHLQCLERLGLSQPARGDIGLSGLTMLPNLKELTIQECASTADVLAQLPELPQIERLCLFLCGDIRCDDLAHLQRLSNLKELDFRRSGPINDECLVRISQLKSLEKLAILRSAGQITDVGLQALQRLVRLKELSVTGDFTPQQVRTLQLLLPNATISVN